MRLDTIFRSHHHSGAVVQIHAAARIAFRTVLCSPCSHVLSDHHSVMFVGDRLLYRAGLDVGDIRNSNVISLLGQYA